MTAVMIAAGAVFGATFGFRLLRWAAHWNGETIRKAARITAVLYPVLFGGMLCIMLTIYPFALLMGVIGSVIAYYALVQKGVIKGIHRNAAWHLLVTGTVLIILITEGLLASAEAGNFPSGNPEFCYTIGTTRSTAALMVGLKSDDMYTSASAARLLGNMRDTRTVPELIAAIKDPNPIVRLVATKSLGKSHDTRTSGILMGLFGDEDPNVRFVASMELGERHDTRNTDALIAALGDSDYFTRIGAANALATIGDKRAVPALRAADHKYHSAINCAFCNALSDLGAK